MTYSRLNTTSIKHRLLSVLALLGVGDLLLLAMVQFTAVATHNHLTFVSRSVFPAALKIQEARSAFNRLEKHYKDAVLMEDPANLVTAERDAETVTAALAELREQVADTPALAQQSDWLIQNFASIHTRSQLTYRALFAHQEDPNGILQMQAARLTNDDRATVAAMTVLDRDIATEFRAELNLIDLWTLRSRLTGLILFGVALLGCAGAWYVLHFQFVLPLQRLGTRMQSIAEGDGDLSGRLDVHGYNEIDQVGRWFNVFIDRIEQIVIRVTSNARELTAAARSLAEISRETAAQTTLQQEQATGISASMHEISTAVEEISRNTHTAAVDARRAEQNAHAGGETIHATVAAIQRLIDARQASADKVTGLGEASQAIGKVVQLIDDIASQTSLLALNASIESARAGEHGRGFAVVAGEVRRLAERTSKATREIDGTVRAIQDATGEIIEGMRANLSDVERGIESAHSAGDTLASIIQGSEAVQRMVSQIASACSEQSGATQSVNNNLSQIARISVNTTGSSASAVRACDHLSELADDLNALVGAFKVRNEAAARPGTRRDTRARLPSSPSHPAAKLLQAT